MSKKDKDEKVEQFKKEAYQIDALLRTEHDPSQTISRVERIIEELLEGNEQQLEYLLNDMLPKFVTTLLKKGDIADDGITATNRLFQLVLQLFLSYINHDFLELSETVCKILMPTATFYMKNTTDEEVDDAIIEDDLEVSSYLLHNVKYFTSVGGLRTVMERMKDPKISLAVLKNMVKIIVRLREFLVLMYLNTYLDEMRDIVYSRILNLSDDELKVEDKRRISDLISFMENLTRLTHPQQASEISEKFQLQVSLKLFNCGTLDKRVSALNDIREMIGIVYKKHEYYNKQEKTGPAPHQWITSKYLVDWILENQIVEMSFGKGIHTEIVRRVVDLVKFLAFYSHLEKSHLDLIWESSQGKHESIKHAIQIAITDLSSVLSYEDLDYLFEKIFQVEYRDYDNQMLIMVRQCTIDVVRQFMSQSGKKKRWHGFEIFWDLLQDETQCAGEVVGRALTYFQELMMWPMCHVMRVPYMEKCIQNLKEFKSVSNSLKLLGRIIATYPEKKAKKEDSIPSVIGWLESEYNILSLYFNALAHLKQQAKLAVTDNINQFVIGRETYLAQIRDRLDFLDYILSMSDLMLTSQQIDLLWDYVITQALTNEERDAAFQWLENARGGSQKVSPPFNDETTDYIFNEKISSLDISQLSTAGFSFFEFYFRYENWKLDKFQQDPNSNNPLTNYIVLSFDLVGKKNLWRIALEAKNETVGQQAILFLNNLHKNLSRELIPMVTQEREEFIGTCMQHLAAASQDFEKKTLVVERCLTILRTFLDEFEIKIGARNTSSQGNPMKVKITVVGNNANFELDCFSSDTIMTLRQKVSDKIAHPANLIRFITSGREVTADHNTLSQERIQNNQMLYVAKRMGMPAGLEGNKKSTTSSNVVSPSEVIQDESALPSSILSQQKYFDQLFSLLQYETVAQTVWELVMLLPVNKKMYTDIYSVQNQNQWPSLLDTSSVFKLLYSLQIVESLLTINNDDSEKVKGEKVAWRQGFLESGGMEYVVNVLTKHSFFENKSKGDKGKVCLSLLLKILNNFVIVREESGAHLDTELFSRIAEPQQLILRLLEIIWFAATSEPPFFKSEHLGKPEASDISIVANSMDLLVAASIQDSEILTSVLLHPAFDTWLSTLVLYCTDSKIRDHVTSGMHAIVKQVTTPIDGVLPLVFLTDKLLGYLDGIEPTLSTCEEYFILVSKLVAENSSQQYGHLLAKLSQMIKQHPTVEVRGKNVEDNVLIGLVNLTRTLASKYPELKTEIGHNTKGGLVQEIFWKCLFDIPTAENHDPWAPPKCKSQKSRKMAFRLLSELARDCPDNFEELSTLLISQHAHEDKRTSWHYLPSSYSKSNTGYVGLKNLGATCYMNSLMQQLYMVPPLRYGLLSAPIEKVLNTELEKFDAKEREEKRPQILQENLLYQMQILLANLQESEKKYFDTKDFVKTYKYDGQPVDPLVQMDADEFFNMLFDRLDTLLKGTPQENLLKEYFGGMLCDQIISKECDHVSEREEKFFTISLETKNKKNISESLDLYVEGELLEGDNKYFCSKCEKKVDAKKRICVGELPDNLIFHLKRFDFDLELLKRAKIYDYCEFPMSINMEAYTKEGLARKEGASVDMKESSYYEYELTGILVHTGSADSGHYYSFIRKREPPGTSERKWYHFNDTNVEPFDPKDIGKNCFGGVESSMQWDPVQNKQVPRFSHKMYSAYMLFYERVKPKHATHSLSVIEESKVVPLDIFQNIWRENMSFLSDKNIFDTDYFSFIWSIVSQTKVPEHVITPDTYNVNVYDPIKTTIELATRFVFITLVHSKEKPNMKEYIQLLKSLYSMHIPACKWLLRNLELQSLRQILFFCTSSETRDLLVSLIIHVVQTLIPYDRPLYEEIDTEVMEVEDKNRNILAPPRTGVSKSSVILFIDTLLSMLREANPHWQHYAQYFLIFREFANAGIPEKKYLLSRNVISQFIDFYLCDESPYADAIQYKRNRMGDKFTSPSLQNMLECIASLVVASDVNPKNIPENSLKISQMDAETLHCEKFYARALHENIHPASTSIIANQLCYEDEEFSKKILEVCTDGINIVVHDGFKPYFDVMSPLLAIQDSLKSARIEYGMDKYIIVVDANSRFANATYFSIKYLLDSLNIPGISDWLYANKPKWLESYVIQNSTVQVREITSQLVTALVPGLPQIYATPNSNKDSELTEFSKKRLHEIIEYLLDLLPSLKMWWRVEMETAKNEAEASSFKLVQYFKLLNFLTLGPAEAALLGPHFMSFWSLFTSGDSLQYPCDENKKELTSYWNLCCVTYPDNIKIFLSQDMKSWTRLLDYFISLSERFIKYNQHSLPSFYNLLRQFCNASDKFLQHVCSHSNFEWATRYLLLESDTYSDAANAVFEIVKLGTASIRGFSTKIVSMALQVEKMGSNYMNLLRVLDVVLKHIEDTGVFARLRGYDQIYRMLHSRSEKEMDYDKLATVIELAVSVLNKTVAWWVPENFPDQPPEKITALRNQILINWDSTSRTSYVQLLLSLTKKFPTRENLCNGAYKLIYTLCSVDTFTMSSTLRYLWELVGGGNWKATDSFLSFVKSILEKALESTDEKPLLNAIVEITANIAKGCLNVANPFFEFLGKLWENSKTQELVKNSGATAQLVQSVLLLEVAQLEDSELESFFTKAMPAIKECLNEDTKTTISAVQIDNLKQSVHSIKTAVDSNDAGFLESSLITAIHVLKAIQVYAQDQPDTRKEAIDIVSSVLNYNQLKSFERFEELEKLFKNLTL